ncbi:N-acylglucosamine 2-epimerase [Paenibacillus sp. J31TS4]|uniref:AGE family epimerase/isomerase n=1 Tax=Paenibacillus sp. J31TS4 TaxID=2807195 RepID=UPI001B2259C2|nr:AGE family epimerase/isomerase [Paenibacillus sp. J31TS4]GIP41174.1 N-acylglucosamine 2-epimerase [Paenibacillus sp. J31TS4]
MKMKGTNTKEQAAFYRDHLTGQLLPFWLDGALDRIRGGVYTCYSNDGSRRVSTDKYVWSQGRFVWLLAKLAGMTGRYALPYSREELLGHARLTIEFLNRYAFLANGNCAFLLTEEGDKKESLPGRGYDTSIFVDAFVLMGFAEYAKEARDTEVLEKAFRLFDRMEARIAAGEARTEPYLLPDGCRAHSLPMIMLNTAQVLAEAAEALGHPRAAGTTDRATAYMEDILDTFVQPDGLLAEVLLADGTVDRTRMLTRHVNPGHTIEDMWFVMHQALRIGSRERISQAVRVAKAAFAAGWDEENGGLLHYVDLEGGPPRGAVGEGAFERNVRDTWESKLWWVHSEALYTSLLGYRLTGDEELLGWYEKTHAYTFATFPNPDPEVGEWIQIRDREGRPEEKVVALPVKDPYHIIRNVLLLLELLEGGGPLLPPARSIRPGLGK